jgi:hypothetical protein
VSVSAQRAELRALASVVAAELAELGALAELGTLAELGASTGNAAAIASGETDGTIGCAAVLGGGGALGTELTGPLARSAGGVEGSVGAGVASGRGVEVRARAERVGRTAAGAGASVLGNGSGMVRRRPSSVLAAAIKRARASR